MRRLVALAGVTLTTLVTVALAIAVVLQVAGVNGPSEWRWPYRAVGLSWVFGLAAVGFGALVIWVATGASKFLGRGTVACLAALGFGFSMSLVAAQSGGLGRVIEALISRHTFGYVYDAGTTANARDLIVPTSDVTERMSMHSVTHPPGALLLIRGIDDLVRNLGPARGSLALKAQTEIAREIWRAKERGKGVPARPLSPWTTLTLAFLLPLLSALAAIPLASLTERLSGSRETALLAAAFWLLLPARSLFTPSLDQALPLLALSAAALAARSTWLRDLAAGFLLFLATFVSWGLLVAAPLVAWISWRANRPAERRAPLLSYPEIQRVCRLGLGFALPWLAFSLATHYQPLAAFQAALGNHGQMAVATRSYLTWIWGNPYDLALLWGPPIFLLAVFSPLLLHEAPATLRQTLAGIGALFALLWLSGSVRGEVARIWLFFAPFACLAAAAVTALIWKENRRAAMTLLGLELLLGLALASSMVFVG